MNYREIIPIPEPVTEILISMLKKTGREMFFYFISGILSFVILIFLMNSFNKAMRFFAAFITGLFLWVPVVGGFFERRNILGDLKNGEMYFVKNFKKTNRGYEYSGNTYEPIVDETEKARGIYILPQSKFVVGFLE